MGMNRVPSILKQHYLFWMLAGISIFLFFFELGSRSFEIKDVPRYAEMAREMIESGNWITTHYQGGIYMKKPPMLMWSIALFSSIGHQVTPFTARLPNALAALGGVLMTYYFVQRLFNQRTAFLTAIVLATAQKYLLHGREVRTDMLFTVFITLALYFFYLGYKQKRGFYIGFYLSLVFATLTKGPLGILFVVSIIVVFLMLQWDIKAIKGMKWHWGGSLFLLIVGAWCIILCLNVGFKPLIATVKTEFLTRVNKPISHAEPFYYYFVKIWTDFMPWSLFIPFSVVYAYKKWRDGDDRITFAFCWCVVIFIFLCAAKAKCTRYMIPLYPALSIIIGSLVEDTLQGTITKPSWLRFSTRWIIMVMAGLSAALIVIVSAYFLKYSWTAICISLIMIPIWIRVFLFLRNKDELVSGSFIVCIFVTIIGWGIFIHSLTIHSKSETLGIKLTDTIRTQLGNWDAYDIRGCKLEGSLWNTVNLNLNMSVPMIKDLDALKAFINTPEYNPLCIIEKSYFEKIKDTLLDDSFSTRDVCTKKHQITLVFKKHYSSDAIKHESF